MKTVFQNVKIVTMNHNQEIITNGYVLIEGTKIVEVNKGDYQVNGSEQKVIDLKGSILMPGLINAHSHSYSNMVKGTSENVPLEIWMLYVMAEGKRLSSEDIYISSLLGAVEMLKGGTTAFLDHLAQPLSPLFEAAKAYQKIGIRAWITPMFTNKTYEETMPGVNSDGQPTQSVKDLRVMLEELYKKLKNADDKIKMGIGPSAPHRCSDELLEMSYEFAERFDLPWHTHVLESRPQQIKAHELYGTSMIGHLEKLNLLSEKCSFAHVVWLTEKEMDILAERNVSVVHNPVSNLYLGSGIMPLIKMKAKGINVSIGTDGVNCNGSQSMFESMKLTSILSNTLEADYSKWLTSMEVLKMATNHSAKTLLEDNTLGSIEVGKEADFIVLNPSSSSFVPLNNLVWQLVYGVGHHISSVYVAGKKVVDNGKVITIDENDLYREANERARSLLDRAQIDYKQIPKERNKIEKLLKTL